MDYLIIIFSIISWTALVIFGRFTLPPFDKRDDLKIKIIDCFILFLWFCLSIAITFISIKANIEKAIIDYDNKKYKIELKVNIDTIKTVKRCIKKPFVPSVTGLQNMKSTQPTSTEKKELEDSLQLYVPLDYLK